MWVKNASYMEQPKVEFLHDLVFEAQGLVASGPYSNPPLYWSWSTRKALNAATAASSIRVPTVRAWPIDDDPIDRADEWHLKVTFPLDDDEILTSASLFGVFQYSLAGQGVDMDFTGGLALSVNGAGIPGIAATTDGDVLLRQEEPLLGTSSISAYSDANILDELIPSDGTVSKLEVTHAALAAASRDRNESLVLGHEVASWAPGRGNTFEWTIRLRIPPQVIVYAPGFGEVLRAGWTHYITLAIVTVFAAMFIIDLAFHFSILQSSVEDETAPGRKISSAVIATGSRPIPSTSASSTSSGQSWSSRVMAK